MSKPLLAINGLESGYGASPALRGVTLTVESGSAVAVLGANGAGKTTLLKAISGALPCWHGTVRLDGKDIHGLAPHRVARRGVAHVPEGRELFPLLSVEDNLLCGAYARADRAGSKKRDLDSIYQRFPILTDLRHRAAMHLSGGEQQMVAIGRALMAAPRLLMLDEPSLGLSPALVDDIFCMLKELNKRRGLTLLLVEQHTPMALDLADKAYLMDTGHMVMEGDADLFAQDEEVRDRYLGRERNGIHNSAGGRRNRAWI
jgi:branched-chain amino acid transport system ATP-binding protein